MLVHNGGKYLILGGFQLEFVSISQVINHMTCYKFECWTIDLKKILCKICSPHCKCLQGITGDLQGKSAISMEKGCKNHRETLYSSKGKIAFIVEKPCNIYRLRGNPMVIIDVILTALFHRYCRFSLQVPRNSL